MLGRADWQTCTVCNRRLTASGGPRRNGTSGARQLLLVSRAAGGDHDDGIERGSAVQAQCVLADCGVRTGPDLLEPDR